MGGDLHVSFSHLARFDTPNRFWFHPVTTSGLIVAAGKGNRYDSDVPKQFDLLNDKPILQHSIATFDDSDRIDNFVLVIPEGYEQKTQDLLNQENPVTDSSVVTGGETRRESVKHGLKKLTDRGPDIVLIHDGARPGVSVDLLDRLIESHIEHDKYRGVIPVMPVTDTIKSVHEGNANKISHTLDRNKLRKVQTPQLFEFDILRSIHDDWDPSMTVTDDAMMLEEYDHEVGTVQGSHKNLKITYRADKTIVEQLLT